MPLITDEIIELEGRLLIWQLTETEEELQVFQNTSPFCNSIAFEKLRDPLRRRQKSATRILLSMLDENNKTELEYTANGKPLLKNKKGTLSISGCKNYVALIYHLHSDTGIDIEEKRPKILRIANKFTNEEEAAWIRKEFEFDDLHLIWGAKEAAFKLIGGGGIDFKKHLQVIKPAALGKTEGKGKILYSKDLPPRSMSYYFRYLEDYVLVYTIVENNNK